MKEYLIEDDDLEISMKVIIVGNGSVGKSSMIQRFCRGVFTRDYKKTIGVDFLEKVLNIDGQMVRLMLWDTAGQEEFDAITRTYYRGASACVLTCSITDLNSFNALPIWKTKVCRECGDDVPIVLVANKFDLQTEAVVDSSALEEMARSLGITKVFQTSVKEDLNVQAVFTQLGQDYLTFCLSLDETKEVNNLLENDTFLTTIDSLNLVTDKPHHQFHLPVFSHFRTNQSKHTVLTKNHKNKGQKVKVVTSKKHKGDKALLPFHNVPRAFTPVILKSHSVEGLLNKDPSSRANSKSNLNFKIQNFGAQKDPGYFFSTSGNHYTHWENKPFKLDSSPNGEHHFKKQKRDLCRIL